MEDNGYGLLDLVTRPSVPVEIQVTLEITADKDRDVSGSRIVKQTCHVSRRTG